MGARRSRAAGSGARGEGASALDRNLGRRADLRAGGAGSRSCRPGARSGGRGESSTPPPRPAPRDAGSQEPRPSRPSRGPLPPRLRARGSGSARLWGGRGRRQPVRPGVPAVAPRARGQRGAGGSAGAEAGAQGWELAGRARPAEVAIACATFLQSCVSALGRPGRRTPRRGAPEPAPRGKPPRPWEGSEGEVYIIRK